MLGRVGVGVAALALLAGCSAGGSSPGGSADHEAAVPEGRAVDVRFANKDFVPQGLALAGDRTAYVSGYDWEPEMGHRECQVAHVSLRTGKVLAFEDFFAGRTPAEFCRHGGGIALGEDGLWLAGAGRLWLIDPDTFDVERIWTIDPRLRASSIALDADARELVFVHFREKRRGSLLRIPLDTVLDPATTTLDEAEEVRIPSRVQGVGLGPRGTWLTRSTSYCGELVTPGGRRVPFVPGAEGIGFVDGHVWVVSESGSGPYQRMGGRPDAPTLTRVSLAELDRTTPAACW